MRKRFGFMLRRISVLRLSMMSCIGLVMIVLRILIMMRWCMLVMIELRWLIIMR